MHEVTQRGKIKMIKSKQISPRAAKSKTMKGCGKKKRRKTEQK